MSAPAKCPLCSTKLQPDWESCPNCPMTFHDKSPEKSALQSDGFRNVGVPILLFGGLAFVLWTASQFMWRTAEESTQTVSTLAKASSGSPLTAGGGVVPSDSAAIQGLVNEQVTGKFDPSGHIAPAKPLPAEDDEGPGTISIMPDKGPREKIVKEWKMRGVVYDLITLNPVPGVHVIFIDNATNSRAQILTDASGRYRAVLPSLAGGGYHVTLSKSGYSKSYLNPGTEGVAEMALARREELVRELSSVIGEPYVLHPNSDTTLVTDFHMAPK